MSAPLNASDTHESAAAGLDDDELIGLYYEADGLMYFFANDDDLEEWAEDPAAETYVDVRPPTDDELAWLQEAEL